MTGMSENEKKKKRAAAISYNPETDNAPVLAAFGEGYVAEKIIERGEEAGIPVMKDPELASMLSRLSVGDEIPPELYEVVAKILVFVSDLDREYGNGIRRRREDESAYGTKSGL
jgi:flagellar biosynthesis protein